MPWRCLLASARIRCCRTEASQGNSAQESLRYRVAAGPPDTRSDASAGLLQQCQPASSSPADWTSAVVLASGPKSCSSGSPGRVVTHREGYRLGDPEDVQSWRDPRGEPKVLG